MHLRKQNIIQPEKPIDYKSIKRCFFSLNTNKNLGHDGISFNVIRTCFELLRTTLLSIFNSSLQTGFFPDELKIAKVILIFKTKDENDFRNYRPTSVLLCFSKIPKRIMYKRLYNHLSVYQTLYWKQFGFQRGHSTEL